jgi:hypothetical protein
VTDDDEEPRAADGPRRVEHPGEERPPGRLVEHLGERRAHALSLAGGEDDGDALPRRRALHRERLIRTA